MASYIVTYDLHEQGQRYDCVVKKLRAYGTYFHMQGSVWIIVSSKAAKEIRDDLKSCLDSNDKLFVARLTGEAAWAGYDSEDGKWLRENL